MFLRKSRKHTVGLISPYILLPPSLAFVASSPPDDQVHAIVANAVVSTAVDERRRKLVGTSIQLKKDRGCDNLTDAARPLGVKTL